MEDLATRHKLQDVVGIVEVADTLIAIPVDQVREVVPVPQTISRLAPETPAMLGAMILRDDTIPIADLSVLLGYGPAPRTDTGIVVILRHDGRLLGLLAQGIRGMATVPASGRRTVAMADGQETTLFMQDGAVIGIYSAAGLIASAGGPVAIEHGGTDRADRANAQPGADAYLLCGYAGHDLALPVRMVDSTKPLGPLLETRIRSEMCDGVLRHHGNDVPMLDTLRVFGLGQNFCSPERSAGVVLRLPDLGHVALEIDRFSDIIRLSPEDFVERPLVSTARPDLLKRGYIARDRTRFLVADYDACVADPTLQTFARLSTLGEAVPPSTSTTRRQEELYIVVNAGRRVACRLADVFEIIRIPGDLLYCDTREDGYCGTITHRKQIVPVFCAAQILGEFGMYDELHSGIIIVPRGGRYFGFKVDALVEVSAAWVAESGTNGRPSLVQRTRELDLIEVFAPLDHVDRLEVETVEDPAALPPPEAGAAAPPVTAPGVHA